VTTEGRAEALSAERIAATLAAHPAWDYGSDRGSLVLFCTGYGCSWSITYTSADEFDAADQGDLHRAHVASILAARLAEAEAQAAKDRAAGVELAREHIRDARQRDPSTYSVWSRVMGALDRAAADAGGQP
jgi:hypothetical protein